MHESGLLPSRGALDAVRRLAGFSAAIVDVARLPGGQHAETWRVDTKDPALSVVVRQFPVADAAGAHEQLVLRTLDGLRGLAPELLDGDLDGRWSDHPTSVISWLDGKADITPIDPNGWAAELGRGLAVVHGVPSDRATNLPSIFDRRGGSQDLLDRFALAGPRSSRRKGCSPTPTSGQATLSGAIGS
jgi:Phosphotransferase enzyme family